MSLLEVMHLLHICSGGVHKQKYKRCFTVHILMDMTSKRYYAQTVHNNHKAFKQIQKL